MSGAPGVPAATEDGTSAAEAFVRVFAEGWDHPGGADSFVTRFLPVLDPEVRMAQPLMPVLVGVDAFRRGFAEPTFGLIPDLRGSVIDWAATGDVVLIELELEGTLGGRPVRWRTIDRVTLRNGLAVERVAYFDPTPLLRALLTRPRAWPGFARMPLGRLRRRAGRGRGR
jgi:ketosteroid isomerase-like protein